MEKNSKIFWKKLLFKKENLKNKKVSDSDTFFKRLKKIFFCV